MHLAPMEQAGSKDFAVGESELEVRGLASTGQVSALCVDETEWTSAPTPYRESLLA